MPHRGSEKQLRRLSSLVGCVLLSPNSSSGEGGSSSLADMSSNSISGSGGSVGGSDPR